MQNAPYIGRFAPSPSGPLHLGSLVAALASYLDAKLHRGQWLVRIEDIDETRSVPGADQHILHSLQQLGLQWDGEVVWQSRRKPLYWQACARLQPHVYACACSRREIADSALRQGLGQAADGAVIYPGTCRMKGLSLAHARTLRLRVPDAGQVIQFMDRRLGLMQQDLGTEVGDFVLQRADGFWSYQMAVAVDDGAQQITHVVRGEDLVDSTARQVYLHRLLQQTPPQWLHVPVVANAQGEKLSKQTGAAALDMDHPLRCLQQAARHLDLGEMACEVAGNNMATFLAQCTLAWGNRLASLRPLNQASG